MDSELEEKMKGKREPHKLSGTLDEGTAKLLKAYVSALGFCIPALSPPWTVLLALRFSIYDLPFMEYL